MNPNVKLEDEPVLSVNDPRCILVLGKCLEFGYCQSFTQKTGQRCQMPINKVRYFLFLNSNLTGIYDRKITVKRVMPKCLFRKWEITASST